MSVIQKSLGDLLSQILSDERIDFVCTDGAYDTKYCRQVYFRPTNICRDLTKKKCKATKR
jgi:hypothetical protein